MSIIRTKSPHRFTVVSNELLAEKNPLSWEAMGLLIYLLSKPDNWRVSIAALTNIGKCGSHKTSSILKELKQVGYIVGKRHSSGEYEYYVYDTPQNPKPENLIQVKKPKPENPKQENPERENHRLINTDKKTNTEKTTTTSAHEKNATVASVVVKSPNTDSLALMGLSERQKEKAGELLAQLSPEQRAIAIQAFNKTVSANNVKGSPMALITKLVELGLKNELEASNTTKSQQTPVTTQTGRKTRLEIITACVLKYPSQLLRDWTEKGYVMIKDVGAVTDRDELRLAGLPV